jgi:hypothetical protein
MAVAENSAKALAPLNGVMEQGGGYRLQEPYWSLESWPGWGKLARDRASTRFIRPNSVIAIHDLQGDVRASQQQTPAGKRRSPRIVHAGS